MEQALFLLRISKKKQFWWKKLDFTGSKPNKWGNKAP